MFLLFALASLYLLTLPLVQAANDDATKGSDPIYYILFIFCGLCSGIVILQLLSRYGEAIPYPVVIFIIGIICAGIARLFAGDPTADAIAVLTNIDPAFIIFVFLPPLVFGEAMNLKWHHVKGAFFPSCLLAGPGVLVGAFLLGTFAKYALPYDWNWNLAMLFASAVAATDTVAVLSLLHTADASQKLTMLIAGESLLNDGVAMTLFAFYFDLLEGISYSFADVMAFAFNNIVSSSLLGMVTGLAIVYWLRSANRPLKEDDIFIQIFITLCAAYVVFFLAEYLAMSGVLACGGAGVMLAWLAPPIILSKDSMNSFWSILEWMANTLIFLLAGLIIGHRTLESVNAIDWLYAFILYIMVMLFRALTVFIFFPWLKINNHQCTVKEAVFVSWAGLRGALSIALAMILENNSSTDDLSSEETSRILFYVGGIVTLSLLCNATLARKVLEYFELIDDCTIEKELVMSAIKKRLRKRMNKVLEQVAGNLDPKELEEIRTSCSLLKGEQPSDLYDPNRDQALASSPNRFLSRSPRNSLLVASQTQSATYNPTNADQVKYEGAPRTLSVAERVGLGTLRPVSTNADGNLGQLSTRSLSIFANSFPSRFDHLHSRIADVSRLLSQDRGAFAVLSPDLLAYVRGIFLEIVRVKYWQNIELGKLPRLSHSAQFLLYTVDVGLDELRHIGGLQDWPRLERHVVSKSPLVRLFMFLDSILPPWSWLRFISRTLGKLEATRDKRNYYMLTSFIEAHEHAQKEMRSFIGIEQNEDTQRSSSADDQSSEIENISPEEKRVKSESEEAVSFRAAMIRQRVTYYSHCCRSKQPNYC